MKKFLLGAVLTVAFTAAISLAGGLSAAAAGTTATMDPVNTANYSVADISHWNNWNTISDWTAASSLNAVYIKATTGHTVTDSMYSSYAMSAENVNLKYGFYHYFLPSSDASLDIQQADYFYDTIKDYNYQCIPVLDIEKTNEADGMPSLSKAQITSAVQTFIDEFKSISDGQDIMIYTYNNFIDQYFGSSLSNYKLWVANYNSSGTTDTNVWHRWTMWQYTNKGSISGITGNVDLDYATDGIFLDTGNDTDTDDSCLLTADPNYTDFGSSKSFNVNAALENGQLMVVTTLSTGEQTFAYQPLTATAQNYTISVDESAVKSTVYLVKNQFNGSMPQTYGLAQFVR